MLAGLWFLTQSPLGALVWIAICGLAFMVGVGQIRMTRAMRRLSRTSVASGPRPPRVRSIDWSPPPPLELRELTTESAPTVAPSEGISILFLWVFDRTATMSLLHRLNQIGPVYFLRGGGMLAFDVADLPRMTFGRIDRMIEETEDEVMQRLRSFRVRRRLGYYSLLTMVCADSVWTFALDRMLERSRIVVVDLSDFVAGRSGIVYEIGLLLDRVPLEQVIFVCGPQTDRDALRTLMESIWDALAMTSPNRHGERAVATLAVTTSLVEDNGVGSGTFSPTTLAEREFIAALVGDAAARAAPKPLPPPR